MHFRIFEEHMESEAISKNSTWFCQCRQKQRWRLLGELGDGAQHGDHVHDLERPLLGLEDRLLARDE